jgi:hypothetical protein
MQRKWTWFFLAALTLAPAGCYRTVLNQQTTWNIRPGDYQTLTISPAPNEQKIKVVVTSSATPVGVYVYLEKDKVAAMRDIEARKNPPANVLALKEQTNDATLEVPIPANNEAVIAVTHAAKSTVVTVKLTN